MKLLSLYIEKYKLFEKFSVDFQNSKHFTVFIGKNGSGKTTLIEAFTYIFSNLFACKDFVDLQKVDFPFHFQITYLLRKEKIEETSMSGYSYTNYIGVEISFNGESKFTLYEGDKKIDGIEEIEKHLRNKGEELKYILPDNFVVYYSGISNSIFEIFDRFQKQIITGSLTGEIKFDQPFYYFLPTNLPAVLIGLLSYEYGNIPDLLENRFSITGFESIKLVFTKPSWAKPRSKADNFWGAMGELSQFMNVLAGNGNAEYALETIIITIESKSQLEAIWSIYGTEKRLFEYLASLQANNFLTSIELILYKSGRLISYQNLSEGEKQLLIISGLKELLAAENSLFLLDEPDTYLHPSWKREFVLDIFKEDEDMFRNYSVITTHSPNILSALKKGQLNILINEEGKSRLKEVSFNHFGKPEDDLLIDFFDVESLRFKVVQEKLDQVWDIIKSGNSKTDEFTHLFNDLEKDLGKDDKALTEIRIELIKERKKMRRINKQAPVGSFQQFKDKNQGADWCQDYSRPGCSGYISYQESRMTILLEEQECLCGYTEILITDERDCHLDHYRKRSMFPQLTFEWKNLIAATNNEAFGAKYKDNKSAIKEADYGGFFNPVQENADEYFYYNQRGEIEPHPNLKDEATISKVKRTIEVFNLQNRSLVNRRRTIIEQIKELNDLSMDEKLLAMKNVGFKSVVLQEIEN